MRNQKYALAFWTGFQVLINDIDQNICYDKLDDFLIGVHYEKQRNKNNHKRDTARHIG